MEAVLSAPARCKICRDDRFKAITKDILGGMSVRKVAIKYDLSPATVQRHNQKCRGRDWDAFQAEVKKERKSVKLKEQMVEAKIKDDRLSSIISGSMMVEKIDEVVTAAESLHTRALKEENISVANQTLNTKLKAVDSYAKLAAEARERHKLQIQEMKSEWAALRAIITDVLAKYPGANEELNDELSKRRSAVFAQPGGGS